MRVIRTEVGVLIVHSKTHKYGSISHQEDKDNSPELSLILVLYKPGTYVRSPDDSFQAN